MYLAQPAYLWLFLLLPWLGLCFQLSRHSTARFFKYLGESKLLQCRAARFPSLCQPWVRFLLLLVAFLCLIMALSDPRLPYGVPRLRAGALDAILLIDVSSSMLAEDYSRQSRLDKAREIIRQLLVALRGNRVGLVTFAGSSFRQAELSEDVAALEFITQYWITENASGVAGSNLAQAIATGLAMFPKGSRRDKLMVLFSDGGDGSYPLQGVLIKAVQRGIRIVTVGLGNLQPSRIPQYNLHHRFVRYRQQGGQLLTTRLHEAPLRLIASTTVRVAHQAAWAPLLTQNPTLGKLITRGEKPVFQVFLFVALFMMGSQMFLRRL